VDKLTKKDIVSLLLNCFAVKEDANKKRKGNDVALLSRKIEAHPEIALYIDIKHGVWVGEIRLLRI
jgi:hypothetical protein